MIKFRQKQYTIQEGHYTGPKDLNKVPSAFEVVGKGTIGGTILGGIVGKIAKDETLEGALTGGKVGFLSGLLLKVFLNYLHNPMTSVKFQEVDKNIRYQFGVYRVSGVTIGDTIDKRAGIEEKFSFNDRNVCSYKINFAVSDNQITMYTYDISKDDLEKLNKILDYYCKKYFGMEYTSSLINQNLNSYSVGIVFTNYQAISNFIMEVSNTLQVKINLLDNKAIVLSRLREKEFSVKDINKYDIVQILSKSGKISMGLTANWKQSLGHLIIGTLSKAIEKLGNDELVKSGAPAARESFGNIYLQDTLEKLHYVEGFNFTVGDKQATDNISMNSGYFLVTCPSSSDSSKEIDSKFWKSFQSGITRNDTGKVIIYTYTIKNRKEFEFLLKKLMSTKITFNIFE